MSLSDRVVVMCEGRMEQVGTPFEIYNFPRTAFVASFVGTLNVLHGTLQEVAGDRVAIEGLSAGNTLRLSRPLAGRRAGEGVIVNLRPEAVQIGSPATHDPTPVEHDNVLPAVIEQITFLGSVVRVKLLLGTQHLLADLFNNPSLVLPKLGEKVTIRFSPDACRIL